MPQLRRGARVALEEIAAVLTEIDEQRQLAHRVAVSNPHYSRDKLLEQAGAIERLRNLLRELEPMLERQAPAYDKRLDELERRIDRLEGERYHPLHRSKETG
jgi:uncharacterized protein Yka (UPF0111/DUF47 family)